MLVCEKHLKQLGVMIPSGLNWKYMKCEICVEVFGDPSQKKAIYVRNTKVNLPTKDDMGKEWRNEYKSHPDPEGRAIKLKEMEERNKAEGSAEPVGIDDEGNPIA